ncbi:pirin family protein [Reinekea sp.]|uniref:pirin family protein n=1 Tax=Reinekea sp. TaxID=1970455 RepID=UPI0039898E2A
MQVVRRANERGHYRNAWLNSKHTFSFGEYYDPKHMGVSVLRVINDDKITPGAGFPTHPHQNMEIVSYVLEGELAHKDSMGNGSVIRPGDVQRMSAGRGVTHSEFNPSKSNGTNFLQIWLMPNKNGTKPDYAQKYYSPEEKQGKLKLLLSPDGQGDSLSAHTDALMYGSLINKGEEVTFKPEANRVVYVHVATGRLEINGEKLNGGDGITLNAVKEVNLVGTDRAEILLFDLPK